MTKVMRYENGKAITGQVDAPFKVDWSEWQTMTDAQKKGKKWLIENVPGAEGEIEAELLTKLWENPAPTSTFAEQNITLASDDYDFLLIIFSGNAGWSNKQYSDTICQKGQSFILDVARVNYSRSCLRVSDTVYSISSGVDPNASTNNNFCVPVAIYGFKKTVKIKFDALAKDVSTLASKCMLEDGETSVEDELNDFCYKPGDVISFTASDYCYGLVTGNDAIINVPINKPMKQVSSASVSFTSSFGFSSILGIKTATGVTVKAVAIGKASIQITLTSTSFAAINAGTPIILGTNFTVTFS